MATPKRSTRRRRGQDDSDSANEAVRQTVSEDAADLEVFEKRRREPALDFEDVVAKLGELADQQVREHITQRSERIYRRFGRS